MKKIFALLMFIILGAAFVSADLAVSSVKLGDGSQERGETAVSSFTLTNTGNETITGIALSVSSSRADYALQLTGLGSTSLAPGASTSVGISGYVPFDLDAVDSKGRKIEVSVGTVTVASSLPDVSAQVRMEAENKLAIRDLDVEYDGESDSVDDGDTVKDIKPGDVFDLTVEAENGFSDTGDCDTEGTDCTIEDVEGEIEVDEGDLDINEDFDLGDIDADEKETASISFDIDEDADDDEYTMVIWITGEDENGALHGDYWEVELSVEREADEITIVSMDLTPDTLSCDEREVKLDVEVSNTGRRDQRKVVVDIKSTKLDLFETVTPFELDERDEETLAFTFLVPEDQAPGTYTIDVMTFYDNDDQSDKDFVQLKVLPCDTEDGDDENPTEEEEETDDDVIYTDKPPVVPPTNVVVGIPEEQQEAGSSDTIYVALLIIGIVIVLLLILLLIAALFKK